MGCSRRVAARWVAAQRRLRAAAPHVLTTAAVMLVWVASTVPTRSGDLDVLHFARIPFDSVVVVAIAMWLPARARVVVAAVAGVLIALLAVVKMLDVGFYAQLDRPFNPVYDWSSFGPALGVVRDSIGSFWTDVVVIALIAAGIALVVLTPLALVRITAVSARHRRPATRIVAAFGLISLAGFSFGTGFSAPSDARLAYGEVGDVRAAIHDQKTFETQLSAPDPAATTPRSSLLGALRGKDVVLVFVESYGKVAIQNSSIAAVDQAALLNDSDQLATAGYQIRSAFLTSPTFGGISWLAHSTLQSGLWVDNQQRYDQLMDSPRYTLSDAFGRAGWRTVVDVPSNTCDWPEGSSFYHYDQQYNATNVGYDGPSFSYARIPDQYTLDQFEQRELPAGHRPVFAEIDLVSSHTPWAPLPRLVPWDDVGDGSVYDPMPAQGDLPGTVWQSSERVRQAYGASIRYSLQTLTSWAARSTDPNLVLIVLGDHQPATIVSGSGASHDVPISIIAKDPAVTDRISSWKWGPGLLPHPDAPAWPMYAFRDRFLSAYRA